MYHSIRSHPAIDGHLGCFQWFAIINNASGHIRVLANLYIQSDIFLGKILRKHLLDQGISTFKSF